MITLLEAIQKTKEGQENIINKYYQTIEDNIDLLIREECERGNSSFSFMYEDWDEITECRSFKIVEMVLNKYKNSGFLVKNFKDEKSQNTFTISWHSHVGINNEL